MSIASEITRLQSAKSALKTAIEGKGVSVPSDTKLDGYPTLVDSIEQGGGGTAESNDVEFIDYDGTIVASYSAAEFANLTVLPDNPDHTADGLTAQGWNWSLTDAKSYVASYGMLTIGQMYVTTDGATKLVVDTSYWGNLNDFYIQIIQSKTRGTQINWGDGSEIETITSNIVHHTYASNGIYTITITPDSDCSIKVGANSYPSIFGFVLNNRSEQLLAGVTRFYCGARVTEINPIGSHNLETITLSSSVTLVNLSSSAESDFSISKLKSLTIPSSVTTLKNIGNAYMLQSVSIPNSITSIPNNAFLKCYSIKRICLPSSVETIGTSSFSNCNSLRELILPNSITNIPNSAFSYCYSLESLTLPSSLTTIGENAFNTCRSLRELVIPNSVTSIGKSAFNTCYLLESLTLPSGLTTIKDNTFYGCNSLLALNLSNVTSIGSSAFRYCFSLKSLTLNTSGLTSLGTYAFYGCKALEALTIPSTLTELSSQAFNYCYSLISLTISNGVTTLKSNVFSNCSSLETVTIPSSVTNIESNVFNVIYGNKKLNSIIMESTTPPTITNSAFNNTNNCTIYVPHGTLSTYQSATNWTSLTSRLVELPE